MLPKIVGSVGSDNITAAFYQPPTTAPGPASPPGQYTIALSIMDPDGKLGNYDLTLLSGVLTITNAPLLGQVVSQSRAYGQTNAPFAVIYTGFASGEGTSVLSGPLSFSCINTNTGLPVGTNSPVGAYSINVTNVQTAANYAITYSNGTLTVTQTVLTVTADNQNRLYGASNPAFTATTTGFVNGETGAVLGGVLGFTNSAVATSPVGGYRDHAGRVDFHELRHQLRHRHSYGEPGPLDRERRRRQPRLWGGQPGVERHALRHAKRGRPGPELHYHCHAGQFGGRLSICPAFGESCRSAGQLRGEHERRHSDGNPASLAGQVASLSRGYGATNPVFTASYSGFVNLDTVGVLSGSLALSCLDTNGLPVDTNSPVGLYPIFVQTPQRAANYQINDSQGTLSVTQAVLTVTADSKSRLYGATNPVFSATITGYV